MNPIDYKVLGYVVAVSGAVAFLRGSSVQSPGMLAAGLGALAVAVAINLLTWKCPHCKRALPRGRGLSAECSGCGRSVFDEEPEEGEMEP